MCESHLPVLVIIFFLFIIAISPAELTQLRDSKLHSIISWVSSTDVFVSSTDLHLRNPVVSYGTIHLYNENRI